MQFGRGLAWIGGVAVIAVVAFIYFGLDRTEREEAQPEVVGMSDSGDPDPFSPARSEAREREVEAAREKYQEAARESVERRARMEAGEATRPAEGSPRAAAEQPGTARETRAGGDREPVPEVVTGRAAIESLFREAPKAPGKDTVTPRDWSGYKTPRESADPSDPGQDSDPESAPGKTSAGSPIVMTCASDPWICNLFNLAFQLPGTIPVISDGTEAIYLPMSGGSGEIWIRTTTGVTRVPTSGITDPGQVSEVVSQVPH
jgi:hypothetical protein